MSEPMVPRIEPLDVADALAAAEAVKVLPQIAELNIFRTLLKHPALAKVVNDLLLTLLATGNKLPARARELLIMRIGWATGCDYEWTQHWKIALDVGISEAELLAVRNWRDADCFDAADRAVLAATDDTLKDGCISATTWTECVEAFCDDDKLLELSAAIGCWRLISQLARSVDIQLEDGVASWPPTGQAPG